MVELKDYFQGIKEREEKILVWIPGQNDEAVAMSTYVDEVFTYEGKLSGLGLTPTVGSGYVEFVSMEQILKFTIVPEGMVDEYFERAQPAPDGNTTVLG